MTCALATIATLLIGYATVSQRLERLNVSGAMFFATITVFFSRVLVSWYAFAVGFFARGLPSNPNTPADATADAAQGAGCGARWAEGYTPPPSC